MTAEGRLLPDMGSGLGLLADPAVPAFEGLREREQTPPEVAAFLAAPDMILLTKSTRTAPVHRANPMDMVLVKTPDPSGSVRRLELFVGLFTTSAYRWFLRDVPILRRHADDVLALAGLPPDSHDGKALAAILEELPRDELFQAGTADLHRLAMSILGLGEQPRVGLFCRQDPFERFASCLVFVPRDLYDGTLRRRHGGMLAEALGGTLESSETAWSEEVPLVRTMYRIRTTVGAVPSVDTTALERQLAEASRRWTDDLAAAVLEAGDSPDRWAAVFPASYRERFAVSEALADRDRLTAAASGARTIALSPGRDDGTLTLKLFQAGRPTPLSDLLPIIEHLGLRVLSEQSYALRLPDGSAAGEIGLQEFTLERPDETADAPADPVDRRTAFEAALDGIWSGTAESDGFNRLIWRAALDLRDVTVLRLYAKVLRQAGTSFSQSYLEDTLAANAAVARLLVRLFRRRFDPEREAGRETDCGGFVVEIEHALDRVENLDQDRILRSYLALIEATLRTNYFQRDDSGEPKPYLSVKLDSARLDLLPRPRPMVEIFVASPRMEGVHLRGGKVARGGIRWSDRREDFRTEILA